MSKQNLKKRYRQSAIVEGARKKHPNIEIEMENGEVFEVDAPQFWPDAATDPEVGPLESAKLIMGDRWDAFVAAGGSMSLLNLVVEQYGEDQKTSAGESSAS